MAPQILIVFVKLFFFIVINFIYVDVLLSYFVLVKGPPIFVTF